MNIGRTTSRVKSSDVLNKKVPDNPKYKHVKSVLDTGASMSKYMAKLEDIRKNYRYKKNELFKRMKVTTFAQLIIQVYSLKHIDAGLTAEEPELQNIPSLPPSVTNSDIIGSPVPSLVLTEGDYGDTYSEPSTTRSTLISVIRGVGEIDVDDSGDDLSTPRSDPSSDVPFLLLDLRDPDDFDKCHIITARSYPIAMLSRSVNNYTKEILLYRNKPGRIIVVYDEDERIGSTAATTLAQRGFDNVFLLSGGLRVAAQKFPYSFITGTVPPSCVPSPPPSYGKKKGKETPPEIVPAVQKEFSPEDIIRLRDLLDEALIPGDTGNRLHRTSPRSQSSASNTSLLSSRASTSMTTHSQPWK